MPSIRSNFSQAVCVTPDDFTWVDSPGGEVQRMMLDRAGDEVAIATSLVRYPPGSRFPAHEHGRGEEYLVLQGEFGDEHGRYPPGTYVRNPPGSRHTPFSEPGSVIWVKLRQFHEADDRQLVTRLDDPFPAQGTRVRELHRFRDEIVTAITTASGASVSLPSPGLVQEVFLLDGEARWRAQILPLWSWVRVPAGEPIALTASRACRLLHKTRPPFALPDDPLSSATSAASAET